MDGSNYNSRLPAGRDIRAEDRAAIHTALLMTVIMVIVTIGAVLVLDAAGVMLPIVSEFHMAE